jgi:hypothetical protein
MNFIKTAALKLNKEEIQGKYGKFMAYIVEGDTMPSQLPHLKEEA